ncbi:hypothetical protein VTK56DRAFT_1874 [Thermocarpiscus australiensis]
MKSLLGLGKSLQELVSSYAWNTVKVEILKRTVLATLWSALWPAYLLSIASTVDNPFSLAKNRSEKAGEILADALINKVQGERPVTLIGYSLGARVIYSCLRSLAVRRAFGLVDTVVLIGAPVPSNRQHWQMMRTVVSGKMFNVYSENDYLLAFLYRATSIQLGVAGLQEIKDIEGVENLNLSEEVQGHMRYSKLIPKILARCEIPVVEGAQGPIERDDDAIKLDDLDKNSTEMATLIDLDGLSIAEPSKEGKPLAPPLYGSTPGTQPPSAMPRKQRSAVTRAAPSALPTQQDPLQAEFPALPSSGLSTAANPVTPISLPQPALNRTRRERSPTKSVHVEHSNTRYIMPERIDKSSPAYNSPAHAISPAPTSPTPASSHMPASPVLTSSHSHKTVDYEGEDDDDDDGEGGFGIKMVDNDHDDLEYVDPKPIAE